MPKYRQSDGSLIDIDLAQMVQDDGSPFNLDNPTPPLGQTFTAADIERVRQEEKDKLYGRIDTFQETIKGLEEKVGTLTAGEQQRLDAARAEEERLREEARQAEEKNLDAKSLIERRQAEWQEQLAQANQSWEQKFETERQARTQAEALAAREREFSDLRDYVQSQVEANKENIAPQLLPWISGNSREEIDAAVARAIGTTNEILADVQQSQQQQIFDPQTNQYVTAPAVPVAPVLPGTRATGGPGNSDPATQYQQLTAEQIQNMDMATYAKLRGNLGVSGNSNSNRGLYG